MHRELSDAAIGLKAQDVETNKVIELAKKVITSGFKSSIFSALILCLQAAQCVILATSFLLAFKLPNSVILAIPCSLSWPVLQNRSLGLALEREKQKAAGLSAELQKTKLIGTVPQAGTTDPQVLLAP